MDRIVPRPKSMRDRNKAATREAIADAALQLMMAQGLDAVRNEDIAEAAGVSSRTFSNYFANKYEALTFRHVERMRYAAEELRARLPEEPLWRAIEAAISAPWLKTEQGALTPSPATVAELKLLFGNRALQGEILKGVTDHQNAFALAIAERLGSTGSDDFYPRLLAAATTVVTHVAIDAFLQSDPPVPQLPLIVEALNLLSRGFPEPVMVAAAAQRDQAGPAPKTTKRPKLKSERMAS